MSIVEDVLKIRSPKPRYSVFESIAKRFSPRVFNDEIIPPEHIKSIFEAARWTPSGRNNQPWFFYSIKKNTKAYEEIKPCIPERNGWALSAPLIIMACYNPTEPQGTPNIWAQYDLGAAVISLILQAQELGYYSRQIGSYEIEKAKNLSFIEKPFVPFVLIAMGRIGNEKDYIHANKGYIDKDLTPSGRKDIVYKELI
jgi:nitroreductase